MSISTLSKYADRAFVLLEDPPTVSLPATRGVRLTLEWYVCDQEQLVVMRLLGGCHAFSYKQMIEMLEDAHKLLVFPLPYEDLLVHVAVLILDELSEDSHG